MDNSIHFIITIGGLLIAGLFMDYLARQLRLPRVTLLLILGVLIGPAALDLIHGHIISSWFPPITNVALSMIGFLLGSKLSFGSLKKIGGDVIKISLAVVFVTLLCVFIGLAITGIPIEVALILAALSTATAPAAVFDVVHELKSKSKFSKLLLNIVAIDDAWCLIVFSFMMALAHLTQGHIVNTSQLLIGLINEIGGAALIGFALGIPTAYFSGRIKPGEATLIEALGIVFIGCGIALWLGVSFILTTMVLGMTVVNLAKHHKRTFSAIEDIEWPFMVIFFIFAGTEINFNMISIAGVTGLSYVIFRVIGKILGGWIGGAIVKSKSKFKLWIGPALMPQAGVAIGLGLTSTQVFPDFKNQILSVVLSSTIIFEIFGPVLTRKALYQSI